jgi:hypothetical protein
MKNQYKIEKNKEKENKINKIEFIASLPPIMSAISIDGLGDGARIKLDISRKYLKEIIQLQLLAGQSFKVIIEPMKEDNYKYER